MARPITDQQILDAALDVIVRRGYTGATTREIAAAAGINEVTLFRRFGSKEKLMRAVVEQEAERFAAAGVRYSGNVEADLLRIVQFYRALMATRGRIIVTIIDEAPRQPELELIMQTPIRIFGEIAALLRRYQAEGVLVEEPPMQALAALVGPLFLGGVFGFLQPQLAEASFDSEALVRQYLRGRSPR
jgi:AcrR family transcriptional regulator